MYKKPSDTIRINNVLRLFCRSRRNESRKALARGKTGGKKWDAVEKRIKKFDDRDRSFITINHYCYFILTNVYWKNYVFYERSSDDRQRRAGVQFVRGDGGTRLQRPRGGRRLRRCRVSGPVGFASDNVAGRRRDVPSGVHKHHCLVRPGNGQARRASHVAGPESRQRLCVHQVNDEITSTPLLSCRLLLNTALGSGPTFRTLELRGATVEFIKQLGLKKIVENKYLQ